MTDDRKRNTGGEVEFCQMDYVSKWPNKVWTCRKCGRVQIRDSADGHPASRCSPDAALSLEPNP